MGGGYCEVRRGGVGVGREAGGGVFVKEYQVGAPPSFIAHIFHIAALYGIYVAVAGTRFILSMLIMFVHNFHK